MFDNIVTQGLLSAGNKERQIAISYNSYCEGIPACTVVVDGGWSKRCHKHSYNAKSGIAVIFGAESKSLLYIGVRNKYCCTCAIAEHKGVTIPPHTCYKNWSSLIGPIRGNNFPKIHARRSKNLLKVAECYLFRPMDRFFCKVVL